MNRIACCALGKWAVDQEKYVLHLLQGVKSAVKRLVIVMHEHASKESRHVAEQLADQLVLSQNTDCDALDYRVALEAIGWATLAKADEVILLSAHCFGPVEPLADFWDHLQPDCDFWEVTGNRCEPLCDHFALKGADFMMGLRKSVLSAPSFRTAIEQITPETMQGPERRFWLGEYLRDAGFTGVALMDKCGYDSAERLYRFDQLLIDLHIPLIPVTAFEPERPENWFTDSDGMQFARLMAHLQSKQDVRPLWKYLLSRTTLSQLKTRFGLLRVSSLTESTTIAGKTVLLMYVPSAWHAGVFAPYIERAIDLHMQVLLFYSQEDVLPLLEVYGEHATLHRIEASPEKLAAKCLLAAKEQIAQADAVCCMLHWIEQGLDNGIVKEKYLRAQLDALLLDQQTINWHCSQFACDPALGLIQAEPATFSQYYGISLALMSGTMMENLIKIHTALHLPLPIDDCCELPNLCCWIRSEALMAVWDNLLEKETSHIISLVEYSFDYFLLRFLQLEGYYPLCTATPSQAGAELLYRGDSLREVNKALTLESGAKHFFRHEMLGEIGHHDPIELHLPDLSDPQPVVDTALAEPKQSFFRRHLSKLLPGMYKPASIPPQPVVEVARVFALHAQIVACEVHHGRVRLLVASDDVQLDDTFFMASYRRYYPRYDEQAQSMMRSCKHHASSHAVYEVPAAVFSHGVRLIWSVDYEIGLDCCNLNVVTLHQNALYLTENAVPVIQSPAVRKVRRLGIFFFFDVDGIVDDYVVYYLKAFQSVCAENCVVVNGRLTAESKTKLEACCDRLIVRENVGFDSAAYKAAVLDYGYDTIAENYDELVLHNFTDFGPLRPFSEMMDEMTQRDNDFWGHCRYVNNDGHQLEGHDIQDHLMSYFLVFKKKLLTSADFREYWDTLQIPSNYVEAVLFHEMRCTGFFEKRGYISDSYMPETKYYKLGNSIVYCPFKQLKEDRSPLLKRKVFFVKDGYFAFRMEQNEPTVYELLAYIRDHTDYDPMLIYKNIMRTQKTNHKPVKDESKQYHTPFSYVKFLNSCKRTEKKQ